MQKDLPKNWNELNDQLWQWSWDVKSVCCNPYVAFRGLSECYENLSTSIQRLNDKFTNVELESRERRLLDNFRIYASEHKTLGSSDWHILMEAQHHGLPTRLLDWSSNPYVALYFATENVKKNRKDGIIWCVKRDKTNAMLPKPFDTILREQKGYNLFYLEKLIKHFSSLETFDKESREALVWFEPPSSNPRFVNQYAFFSVMPGVGTSTSEWLKRHSECFRTMTIPFFLKDEIRKRLAVMNITRRTIYPGLDSVSKWLEEFYKN